MVVAFNRVAGALVPHARTVPASRASYQTLAQGTGHKKAALASAAFRRRVAASA